MKKLTQKDIDNLLVESENLKTFEDVQEWDNYAQEIKNSIDLQGNNTEYEIKIKQSELQRLESEQSEKSFLEKITSGNKEGKTLQQDIINLEKILVKLKYYSESLQSRIDITPNSPEDQSNLLRELYLEKKELDLKKKELIVKLREIRTNARQKTVNSTDSVVGILGGSKYRASVRRGIRYEKEQVLSPHEDEKSYIERQILQIEKDIFWVEKFKYKNPPKNEPDSEKE